MTFPATTMMAGEAREVPRPVARRSRGACGEALSVMGRRAYTACASGAAHWLVPSLEDAVRLTPRRKADPGWAENVSEMIASSPSSRPGDLAGPAVGHLTWGGDPADRRVAVEPSAVRDALARVHAEIQRSWLNTAGRRGIQAGLIAGLVAALFVLWLGWSVALVPIVVAATAAVIFAPVSRGTPTAEAAARYLDRQLRLREALATALDLESAGRRSPLSLLQRYGAAVTAAGISAHRAARPARPPIAWAVPALLLCATIAVLLLPRGVHPVTRTVATANNSVPGALSAPPGVIAAATKSSIVVHVATVDAPANPAIPGHRAAPAQQAHKTSTLRTPSSARASGTHPTASGGSSKSSAGQASTGKQTASGSQRSLPFLQGSQSFLPTSPSTKGAAGAAVPASPARAAGSSTGSRGTSNGSAAGTSAKSGAAKGSGSTSGQNGKGSGTGSGSAAGKPGAGSGTRQQCLYGCLQITKSQLTTPGLITGKGQFTGTGTPGGQTAGHSAGSALKPGSATAAASSSKGHQLTLNSPYNPAQSGAKGTRQATGHNGPGTTRQAVVSSGVTGVQPYQYVPPDANLLQPGDDGLILQYFRHGSAS